MNITATCALCGAEYEKKNGKSKYCSDACKKAGRKITSDRWRSEHKDYTAEWRKAHPNYASDWLKANPHYGRDRSRKARDSKEYRRNCVVCGTAFCTWIPHKHTCSDECECSRRSKRIPYEQVVDTNITVMALYKRDKGICYLCGEPCDLNDIDRSKNAVGKNYPSIDHVYPLVRGGKHSWDNVKLAHVGCNASKRDKVV